MSSLPEELVGVDPTKDATFDEKIFFDQVNGKWVFEGPSADYEFNDIAKIWTLVHLQHDEEQLGSQKRSAESIEKDDARVEFQKLKKQKIQEMKERQKKEQQEKKKKVTACYITNLPGDIQLDELKDIFGKYGLISEDLLTGQKRIKIYKDEKGNNKGDALVIYHRQESVDLAIEMLDDTPIRTGEKNINVQQARFPSSSSETTEGNAVDGKVPEESENKPKKELTEQEKKLINRKIQTLNKKLNDWDEDEDDRTTIKAPGEKYGNIVVLKHCFTLKEIESDPYAASDIEEDMQDECSGLGKVIDVKLFDMEAEGVVMIKFSNSIEAESCIKKMNGRFFGGQKLMAIKYQGENYKRKKDADESEEARLEKFGDWLENQ